MVPKNARDNEARVHDEDDDEKDARTMAPSASQSTAAKMLRTPVDMRRVKSGAKWNGIRLSDAHEHRQ